MNRKGLLVLILSLPLLFSCQSNGESSSEEKKDYYLGEPSYSFNDGKAKIAFKSKDISSFNLYEKKNDTSSYTLIGKINETSFETTNYTSSFKVVSLFNEKENNDYFLEIKPYFDGVFDNENVKVFSPNNNHNEINNYIDSNYKKLRSDEWSNKRIEMLFIPGN